VVGRDWKAEEEAMTSAGQVQVFEIAKSNGGVWLALLLLLPVLISLLAVLWIWPRPLSVEVGPDNLEIRGSLYGRRIQRSELLLERARVVDLESSHGFGLARRSNGTGLPGYSVGWFQLDNSEKALVFVTDRKRVAYIPTRKGYSVLLSVLDPEALLRALGAEKATLPG
jgi:hypothetical protein